MSTCIKTRADEVQVSDRATGMFHSLVRKARALRDTCTRFGTKSTVRLAVSRIGARFCGLQVTQVVWLDVGEVVVAAAAMPAFTFRTITAAEVAEYARDPENDLEPEIVARAADTRNTCFAALDGDRLAAYGWYARDWIEPEHCYGFGLRMPPHVAYMYKGFTHPDYRGLRLHGIAMGLALRELSTQGVTALISTVEWTNEASLRSCDRLGYRRLGAVAKARVAGCDVWRTSRRVREHGVAIIRPGKDRGLRVV